MAELFESPIPTTSNVAHLRKMFGSEDDIQSGSDANNENDGNVQLMKQHQQRQQKTPKM
jgi:hypothetical protein